LEIHQWEISYEHQNGEILLVPFGDQHVGHVNSDKKKIEEYVGWIANTPNIYWFGTGDYSDCIIHSDERRYDFDCLDPDLPTPDEQYQYVAELLGQIKDKCLGLLYGNHDFELQRRHGHRYVALDLIPAVSTETRPVPFLGYNAMIKLKFKRKHKNGQSIIIVATHGSSNARTPGGKINALLRWAQGFNGDVFCYAHTHDKYVHEREYYELSTNMTLVERRQIFCLTGGFLEGYKQGTTSYVERKNLEPMKTGIVKISIWPETKKLRAQA